MSIEPEIFTAADLKTLRDELRGSGLDSFQAAEMIGAFLTQRGYGVSNQDARSAAARMESFGCDLATMRQELHQIALMM
jgi:hypothetical protein